MFSHAKMMDIPAKGIQPPARKNWGKNSIADCIRAHSSVCGSFVRLAEEMGGRVEDRPLRSSSCSRVKWPMKSLSSIPNGFKARILKDRQNGYNSLAQEQYLTMYSKGSAPTAVMESNHRSIASVFAFGYLKIGRSNTSLYANWISKTGLKMRSASGDH